MKVMMVPHLDSLHKGVSGIHTVVKAWFKHLPKFGVELVGSNVDSFDVLAIHAGMSDKISSYVPIICHAHGLYWSADYPAEKWEWVANRSVVFSMRAAAEITVPSNWVAETIRRDMRYDPVVLPHGIDWDEWQHTEESGGYVVGYAKNRAFSDVCNPVFLTELARRFPNLTFVSTFAPPRNPPNVKVIGILEHDKMKQLIQRAALVISPVKETFGILTLEAMASGVPVLGYAHGGNLDLIQHGVSGYLAKPGDYDDLGAGLSYCLQYRNILGANGREVSRDYTWEATCQKLTNVYEQVLRPDPPEVSVIIPAYMYAGKVQGAIESVQNQTFPAKEIIVIDDASPDEGRTQQAVEEMARNDPRIQYHHQPNAGVAVARNNGISKATSKYILCLDADDRIAPQFLEACLEKLEANPTLGIAYTGLLAVTEDGRERVSQWPGEFDFDKMVKQEPKGINQIPTACVFRKEMWRRLGGYRQRYAPQGAGSEDAEFWLRACSHGWGAIRATEAPLFIYAYQSGRVSGNKQYQEVSWHELHPWTRDELHPFPSVATPIRRMPSHPVRQYDEPVVSVVIPVGPDHTSTVFDALDSLESQSFRKWEAIVVDDTGSDEPWSFDGVPDALQAYPYVRLVKTPGSKGAGYARNRGAEAARGSLLFWLDADDIIVDPNALANMVQVWNQEVAIVYSDYLGKAYLSQEEATKLERKGRLINYDQETGLAMNRHYAVDYDCERAILQPADPLFIWCLVSSLVPKAWHDEIGGFDESMHSWEDWVYWLEMARAGKCFVHIPEPYIAYRFYTGQRREIGGQDHRNLLQYIIDKFRASEVVMPCRCSGNKRATPAPAQSPQAQVEQQQRNVNMNIQDQDMILCTYTNPNRGSHRVVGAASKLDYGYRTGGEVFYVHADDVRVQPHLFVEKRVEAPKPQVVDERPAPAPPPAPQEMVVEQPVVEEEPATPPEAAQFLKSLMPLDLQSIPGVTGAVAKELDKQGVQTLEDLVQLGTEGLQAIKGIGEARAVSIFTYARKKLALE